MSALVRRLGYGGTLCLAVIVSFALLALFAPWLSPYPDQGMGTPNVIAKLKPPSADFWLGTDHLGRDVLSRVIFGARVSMSAGLLIVGQHPWPLAELRCDWEEGDPIAHIARAWGIYKPQMDAYQTRALDPRAAPAYGVAGEK